MASFLLLALSFVILGVVLLRQIYLAVREKFIDRQRLFIITLMTIVLLLTFLFPGGLVNFDQFEGTNLLIAQREGVANCMTTLKLKENNKFIQEGVCFGKTEITGVYRIKEDTIFFDKISYGRDAKEFYKYAVIKNHKKSNDGYKGYLELFQTITDTTGVPLLISKNELIK